MKAIYLTICVCLFSIISFGQLNKFIGINTTAIFNFHTKGLALNDAGFGINLDVSAFSKYKLQLLVEGSSEVFIGDKLLYVDSMGKENKSNVIKSIKAGLQYFIFKRVAVFVMIGPAWHRIETHDFTSDYEYKYGVTCFLGCKERLVIKLFMVDIPKKESGIRYWGIGLGFRIY